MTAFSLDEAKEIFKFRTEELKNIKETLGTSKRAHDYVVLRESIKARKVQRTFHILKDIAYLEGYITAHMQLNRGAP